jgi:hypothetical protein
MVLFQVKDLATESYDCRSVLGGNPAGENRGISLVFGRGLHAERDGTTSSEVCCREETRF